MKEVIRFRWVSLVTVLMIGAAMLLTGCSGNKPPVQIINLTSLVGAVAENTPGIFDASIEQLKDYEYHDGITKEPTGVTSMVLSATLIPSSNYEYMSASINCMDENVKKIESETWAKIIDNKGKSMATMNDVKKGEKYELRLIIESPVDMEPGTAINCKYRITYNPPYSFIEDEFTVAYY